MKLYKIFSISFFAIFLLILTIAIPLNMAKAVTIVIPNITVTADSTNILSGGNTTIRWSSTNNPTSCSLYRSDTGATVTGLSASGSYFTGALSKTTTFTITCISQDISTPPAGTCKGTVAGSKGCSGEPLGPDEGRACSSFTTQETCLPSACNSWYHHGCSWSSLSTTTTSSVYYITTLTCFVSNTAVAMADGTTKKIQDVKVGDILKGDKTNNTVLGLHRPELNGKLYSFNGGRYFVTEEHPFKTTEGWKSINPKKTKLENIGIEVTSLNVGDTLITENGNVLLESIKSKEGKNNTDLFNFILDGDHTYYADGYLVHNKQQCRTGGDCPGGFCIDMNGNVASSGTCPVPCSPNGQIYPGSCDSSNSSSSSNSSGVITCLGGYKKCVSPALLD